MSDVKLRKLKNLYASVDKAPPASLFELRATIAKISVEEHLVFGWLYVCETADGEQVIDASDEYIEPADLEVAVYEYVMSSRAASLLHHTFHGEDGTPIAECCESVMFTREKQEALGLPPGSLPVGWWIGLKVHDEDVWQAIKSGELEAFSIGGSAIREPSDPIAEA